MTRANAHDDRRDEAAAPAPGAGTAEPAADAAPPATGGPPAAEAAAAPAEAAAELRDRWLRAEAELQNYRRRAGKEREEIRRAAEDAVLLETIAVLDDFDRALDNAGPAGVPEAWLQGVRLIDQRLHDGLTRWGVRVIDPLGQPFDPAFHEALLEIDAPEGVPPGHVAQVVQKGYARGERALRAARVVVARHPAAAE